MQRMHTLNKYERLKSKKLIERLFKEGNRFSVFPFKVVVLAGSFENSSSPVQFGISVPNKVVPKAVNRNRIKRQVREAWRQNKLSLYEQLQKTETSADGQVIQLCVMLIFTSKKACTFDFIQRKLRKVIFQLGEHYG